MAAETPHADGRIEISREGSLEILTPEQLRIEALEQQVAALQRHMSRVVEIFEKMAVTHQSHTLIITALQQSVAALTTRLDAREADS